MAHSEPAYKKVLLKLSGESLLGKLQFGIDLQTAHSIAKEIRQIYEMDVHIAIMIGGGNIFRGVFGTQSGMERVTADYMGLLATMINGIALQYAIENEGLDAHHVSAVEISTITEPFVRRKVLEYIEEKKVVVFSAGIGSPYFTTDTAAALRALEIGADVILKATKVDGVYSSDPMKDKSAKKFDTIKYMDVIKKGLKVMDLTAISLCRDNNVPIIVFNLNKKGNMKDAVLGKKVGTMVN